MQISKDLNELCYKLVGVCMEVHREIGPGFPEEYYQKALEVEFGGSSIEFESQKPIPMFYKGTQIGMNYLDFLIEEKVILEIKSVRKLDEVHLWQVLKYLAVCPEYPVALVINFGHRSLESKRVLPTKKMQDFRANAAPRQAP